MPKSRVKLTKEDHLDIGRMLMNNIPESEILKKYKMTKGSLSCLVHKYRKKGVNIPYKTKFISEVAEILKKESVK